MIDLLVKTRDLGLGVANNGFGFKLHFEIKKHHWFGFHLQVFDLRVGNNSFVFVCVRVCVLALSSLFGFWDGNMPTT